MEEKITAKKKIIAAAMREFGTKEYKEASLNTICAASGISKGLIYHYFENKLDLYLYIVGNCFDSMAEYINARLEFGEDRNLALSEYFRLRNDFFNAYPDYRGVFSFACFRTPEGLGAEIDNLRFKLKALNEKLVAYIFCKVKLRSSITETEAVNYLEAFSEFYYEYFVNKMAYGDRNKAFFLQSEYGYKALDLILFGISDKG